MARELNPTVQLTKSMCPSCTSNSHNDWHNLRVVSTDWGLRTIAWCTNVATIQPGLGLALPRRRGALAAITRGAKPATEIVRDALAIERACDHPFLRSWGTLD